jgi:hypothetical protein
MKKKCEWHLLSRVAKNYYLKATPPICHAFGLPKHVFFFLGGRLALILQIYCGFYQCICLQNFQSPPCIYIYFVNIPVKSFRTPDTSAPALPSPWGCQAALHYALLSSITHTSLPLSRTSAILGSTGLTHLFMTSVYDLCLWPPFMTSLYDLCLWPLFMTSVYDLPLWPPFMTSVPCWCILFFSVLLVCWRCSCLVPCPFYVVLL